MVSQPVQQTITIHILPNVSRIKGNETMKFAQVIEYSKKNVFLQKSCKKRGRETSSRRLFAFLKKLDIRQKGSGQQLISIYFNSPQLSSQ